MTEIEKGMMSPHPLATPAPSFVQHFRDTAEPQRTPRHDAQLSERVRNLASYDLETFGDLPAVSFSVDLRRAIADDCWCRSRALIRDHPNFSTPELATPGMWIREVLHGHDKPDILKIALPTPKRLAFGLRMELLSWLAHSVFRLMSVPYLDGEALARHWRRIPDAGKAVFPEHFGAALEGLARLSPDGQLALSHAGRSSLHAVATALFFPEGELVAFLTASAKPKKNGKATK